MSGRKSNTMRGCSGKITYVERDGDNLWVTITPAILPRQRLLTTPENWSHWPTFAAWIANVESAEANIDALVLLDDKSTLVQVWPLTDNRQTGDCWSMADYYARREFDAPTIE